MNGMKRIAAAMLAAVMLTGTVPAAAAESTAAVVSEIKASTMYITKTCYSYESTDGDAAKVKKIYKGTAVKVMALENGFYRLSDGSYVAEKNVGSKRINWTNFRYKKPRTRYVSKDDAKVYSGAMKSGELVCTLEKGTELTVIGRTSSGYYRLQDGTYIKKSSTSAKQPVQEDTAMSSQEAREMLMSYFSSGTGLDMDRLRTVTSLDMSDCGISNISVISEMTALTELDLSGNKISDISSLSKLTKLQRLCLNDNDISDISALSSLTELTSLSLYQNDITNIYPLKGLNELTELWINNNRIGDITALSGMKKLTKLGLYDNRLTNIKALSGLTGLTELWLNDNYVSDLTPVSGLVSLRELSVTRNKVTDTSPLSDLTGLEYLDLSENSITDISALSGMTELKELWLNGNIIFDIRPIAGMKDLDRLSLSENRLSDLSPLKSYGSLIMISLMLHRLKT